MSAPELSGVGLEDIRQAAKTIAPVAYRTPLVPASRDEQGLFVKLEALQRTGSFKIRGAFNRMQATTPQEREAGFVTISAGNHGQAVAWCAKRLGASCTVYVPEDAVEAKVAKMKAMGAEIERMPHGEIMEAMETRGFEKAGEATYVHPFGDPAIVAGQGTVGLEIHEQAETVGTVLVPVGGGGLSSGIGTALSALSPETRVLGVQSTSSPALKASFERGEPVVTGPPDTFADGVATDRVFAYMWPLLEQRLDGGLAVDDDAIEHALRHLATETHVVAEGAGAAALAAAHQHRDELDEPIVAVVSGGNVDPNVLARILGSDGPT